MRVLDIMSQPVYTVRDTDTIESAAALLTEHAITAAPVLDETGELAGMISEGDLLWHRVPRSPLAHAEPNVTEASLRPKLVLDVMSANPLTTTPLADIADVADDMIHYDVRSMPVLDSNAEVVGIVSRRDIVRSVVRTDESLAQEIQQRLDAYGGGVRRWRVTVVDAIATIEGLFDDETERTVAEAMVRTTPGIAAARLTQLPSQ